MKMNRTIARCRDRRRSGPVGGCCTPCGAKPPATPDQIVAALKQNLAESQKRLRQYEWIETTVISLKGEEKSRKQQRVFYGADGKLTKLPLGEPPPQAASGDGGRRGGRAKERIVENKKNEMQEYMEKAAALIHQYVPPSPERIQQAKDAGNVQLQPQPDGKGTRRAAKLRSALGPARHRPRREGGNSDRAQRRDLSREEGRRGDTRRRLQHPGRRHELRGPDDARSHGEEHQRGRSRTPAIVRSRR